MEEPPESALEANKYGGFNRLLNGMRILLNTNGQTTTKLYVPRSIQRVKDTETVAFIRRVDV